MNTLIEPTCILDYIRDLLPWAQGHQIKSIATFVVAIIEKQTGLREVIRTLKSGGVVGILADLNALRPEGIFCDFFGTPAATTVGVATLALRTNAVVLPGYLVWEEAEQRHVLHFEPPVETIRTGYWDADVQQNTARYTALLESIIRRYPGQWLWIHRRWRTRPPGEPDIY